LHDLALRPYKKTWLSLTIDASGLIQNFEKRKFLPYIWVFLHEGTYTWVIWGHVKIDSLKFPIF